ncbi:phosphoenolpyruvate--protein phosphotransferase [Chlorobaculum thiosulfatiphilum]|uniref:Phosphoenolpyruvate-protein phosphotransferase n=1 Tax=Chlorobaculum thiosulfatiphilum TaxID=115852 RepID=A0A5C4S380_CHLTI|nr:phosphoenolpyruvate--protein phosphotransferase [Chlorobaculum thiosulfatiphilum]TNJ37599.1 phosphoenolpyruvate--protein phosphotransferase [Chlorobaculum thiosulfatiphilum]
MVYRKAPKSSGNAPDSSASSSDHPASSGNERRYHGIGSAKGFAIGETYEFVRETIEHETADLSAENIEEEVERFMTALHRSEKELKKIERVTTRKIGRLYSDLFQAQIMLLRDPVLTGNITSRIRAEVKPAHLIIEQEFGKFLENFINSDDLFFRERAADLHDIKERIIRNLHIRKLHSWVPEGSIVVSHHLSPADIILLSRSNIKGFATDTGGKTSHISLICKSLNIPIVVGLGNFSQKALSGSRMILDGSEGVVITDPADETVETYIKKREEESKREADDSIMAHRHAFTRCGVRISVCSNIDFKEEIEHLDATGSEGVGLFRTENLFLDDLKPPKEAAQQEYYRAMAEMLTPKPLVIRLFDIGGDKLIYSPVKEPNPNLGWRGVRILIDVPEILDTQLQAVIKANIHGNIDVLIPMISSIEEVMHIKQAIEKHYDHIKSLGHEPLEKPGIGAMIEMPAAVELIDEITRIVDFVSIGTNDLTQYTLAVDRNNLIVQDLFEKFHPAIIRQLHRVITTAQRNRCRVSICGDMGSDPLAAPYLIGCGLREFSIVSSDIPALKATVGKYTVEECEALAAECLKLSGSSAIKARLEAFVKAH